MIKKLWLILPLIVGTSCAELSKKIESDWSSKMNGLAASYNSLLPYLYDEHEYAHPKNEKTIRIHLQNIVEDSGSISDHIGKKLSGSDPYFRLGIKQLRQTTKAASESFDAKEFTYSQQLAQNSLNYCFKCHSRSTGGTEFIQWDNFKLPHDISSLEKSRILIATRQFEKASSELEKYIHSYSENKEDNLLKAMKFYLMVTLRHQVAPVKAESMIQRFKKSRYSGKISKNMTHSLEKWEKDIRRWSKDLKNQEHLTFEKILAKNQRSQPKTMDYFAQSLRESLVLHQSLHQVESYEDRAKTYYLLGRIYTAYPELGFWDLPDLYFETCINLKPYSDISRKCYFSLESKINSDSKKDGDVILLRRDKDYLLRLKALTGKHPRPGATGEYY